MILGKIIIGVCLTRVQSIASDEYLSRLHKLASEKDWRIIVFNSPVDFYNNDSHDLGAKSVYKLIDHDQIDLLVVAGQDFLNKSVMREILTQAKAKGTPVILLKDEFAGCASIKSDYEDGFKDIVRHIVKDKGVTDVMFMAGRGGDEDKESQRRIGYFRDVLEENGLEFSDDLVEYGEYWDIPTIEAIERILAKRKPPRALICANDYMAMAACRKLEQEGYRIPEDVLVTGFDGVPEADHHIPQLTTCKEDFDGLAQKTVDLAEAILSGERVPKVTLNSYRAVFTESSGDPYHGMEMRREVRKQYSMVHDSLSHEEFVYGWLSQALETRDMSTFMKLIPELVLALGYLCLNSDFIDTAVENLPVKRSFPFTDTLDIVCSKYSPYRPEKLYFPRQEMVPGAKDWIEDDAKQMFVVSALNSGTEVYGYYAVRTGSITQDAHAIHRTLNAMNVGFFSIVSYYRQRIMLLGLKKAALTDHLTGLPNLKGTTEWFDDFAAVPENHKKCLTVSIYWLPKYKYIYENYGISQIEECVCRTADMLKAANEPAACIGHVSDDEFLVINVYDDREQIAPTINDATSKFYGLMGTYRVSLDLELEVNAGCTELYPGWEGTLEIFSKLASNAMYLNRLNNNFPEAPKARRKLPQEVYKAFDLLIEKNMFDYHFQPIVDKTGEIVAYEALMRPHKAIGMNPLEVLEAAEEYGRLYDVEKATLNNVLRIYDERNPEFRGRKIFINTIPGHFLSREDLRGLRRYRPYISDVVIELTEGSAVTDKELGTIREVSDGQVRIAIDDYGTGHSNIVNLLRYSPQIIKVDRYLISGIQNDTNKQLFFRSTVEFAAMNGIRVLAEGVETAEELRCVLSLGADLIQGYFTGRPAPDILESIAPEVKVLFS